MHRGTSAEIDLNAIKHNLKAVRGLAAGARKGKRGKSARVSGKKPTGVIAVVKADAYGHGAVEVSRLLEKEGVSMLAVAYLGEALELREAGIKCPVLVLFDASPAQADAFFEHSLTPVLYDVKKAGAFSKEALRRKRRLDVHIKIDTGMGRLGLGRPGGTDCPGGEGGTGVSFTGAGVAVSDASRIARMKNLRVRGLMSHFSEAELADMSYAKLQLDRFREVKRALGKLGTRPLCHMANSAAVITFAESHMDAVRPGLMLYGVDPTGEGDGAKGRTALRPAMMVSTQVLALRRLRKGASVSYGRTFVAGRSTRAAVIPAGYADGYMRAFSNNADVLIRGRRAPVIGRVCMDLTVVDVTDVPGVREGDEAVLLGNVRREEISAWELADRASTIPYEVLTSLGTRAHRKYRSK